MRSEWQKYKVEDFAEIVGGGTPSTKQDIYWGGDIPWLTPKDLSREYSRYVSRGERNISRAGLNSSSAHILPTKTILLTSRAPVGYVAIAKNAIATNQGFRNLVIRDGFDPDFIYYLLLHNTAYLKQHASGSTFQELSGSVLKSLEFLVPPYHEQRAIAHILGSLDDKIELNRRLNKTLEAMARAIFKSWFVDFDPVRASAKGRDPGLPDEIAALFPDSFEYSELGEIPKGWEVKSLDEIADYLNGLACQKYPPEEGKESLPVIKIRELRQGITASTDRATVNVPDDYIIEDGDVLFSWSGSLLIDIWTQGHGVLNQHLFKVSSAHYPKWFFFYWIEHHLPEFQQIASYKATTMGHIKRHHLSDAKVNVPNDNVMQLADEHISPLFERRIQNELETRELSIIRNILLPKLISGELRVPDAEKFVEEAT